MSLVNDLKENSPFSQARTDSSKHTCLCEFLQSRKIMVKDLFTDATLMQLD